MALRYLRLTLLGAFFVATAYGIYHFPAAPIRYVDGEYRDKRGRIHTREDFECLHLWGRVFFTTGMAAIVSFAAHEYAKRWSR